MKQSTKLLSLVLALVMAFSCMAVIGNALKSEVQKDVMNYDAVDDAIISAEGIDSPNPRLRMTKNFFHFYTYFPIEMLSYYMYNVKCE